MAKLPIKVKEELVKANDFIPSLVNIIKKKKENDPNLAEWYKEKSVDYYEGLLAGKYGMIESLLMAYGAYRGYSEHLGYRSYTIE